MALVRKGPKVRGESVTIHSQMPTAYCPGQVFFRAT